MVWQESNGWLLSAVEHLAFPVSLEESPLFQGKESLKQYLLLLPASVLKAEFISVMYLPWNSPLFLAYSLFPVCSLVVGGLIALAATLSEMDF